MEKKRKRKYLIDKKLQLGAGFLAIAIQIPCVLATGLGLSWFYLIYLDDRTVAAYNTGLFTQMAVVGIVLALFILYFSMRLTHSVVGPVKKTRAVLGQMAAGCPPEKPVKFRKFDQFKELAVDLNILSDYMLRTTRSRSRAKDALASVRQMLESQEADTNDQCIKKIDEILERL